MVSAPEVLTRVKGHLWGATPDPRFAQRAGGGGHLPEFLRHLEL